MFRFASNNLFRKVTLPCNRMATENRQPCRFLESLSYGNGFKVVKHGEDDNDQSTRTARPETEHVFQNGVLISAYSEYGFRLNSTVNTLGPIILFPRSVFPWRISSIRDINEDSLCIFYLVKPKIDTVILGIGDERVTSEIARTILEMTRKHRINIEILSTETACTTFNFLTQQGRMVAAALTPPRFVQKSDDDTIGTQTRDGNLFSMEKMTLPRYN